jgi:hypothetical protein
VVPRSARSAHRWSRCFFAEFIVLEIQSGIKIGSIVGPPVGALLNRAASGDTLYVVGTPFLIGAVVCILGNE